MDKFANLEQIVNLGQSPFQIYCLEFVESGQDTCTSNTTEDIGTGTLHEGHETFILDDLNTAVNGSLVLNSGTWSHHHTPTDSVNGVGHQTSGNGHTPTQQEGQQDRCVISQKDRLQGIVKTEIHATIDKDTNAGNGETTVQALDTVGFEGLGVDIDETVELTFATLAFSIVSQPGTSVIKGIHESEGKRTGESSGWNVGSELDILRCTFVYLENGFDGILEGKVEGLCGEISQHIGQVTSPEWDNTLASQGFLDTVNDSLVWFGQTALSDHLILILNQEFDSLNGGGSSFGNCSGNTGQHKVFQETQLLLISHFVGFL